MYFKISILKFFLELDKIQFFSIITNDRIFQNYSAARLRFYSFFGGLILERFTHEKSTENMVTNILKNLKKIK